MRNFPNEIKDNNRVMSLDSSRLLLSFKNNKTQNQVETLLHKLNNFIEDINMNIIIEDINNKEKMIQVNHTNQRFWVRTRNNQPIDQKLFGLIQEMLGNKLEWIGPVYFSGNVESSKEILCTLPNVLILKLNTNENASSILSGYGLTEIKEKSKYLGGYQYYVIGDEGEYSAYELKDLLLQRETPLVTEVHFENMPLIIPTSLIPNDTMFTQQWNMTQIQAGGPGLTGWNISTGNNIVVAVIDTGCDLNHPDLQFWHHPTTNQRGTNLNTLGTSEGSPINHPTTAGTIAHGTACAGIVAGTFNNSLGVSGTAGNCTIMPLAFTNWTDAELAAGINFASMNNAQVISMSFFHSSATVIDTAIQNAFSSNIVMCAATGNDNKGTISYPASSGFIIACGASDQADNRKTPVTSNDWGSNFGAQISVVAPGINITTTDIQGNQGYNTSSGTAGDYTGGFSGTSAATPHVAGLAALLRSQYPALRNTEVRNIIERTAEKVGSAPYAETAGYPNGTWNQEMGYGRINVLRALDFSDLMIRDWPSDTGIEPSNSPGGVFWEFSDIFIRETDDNVLNSITNVQRGRTTDYYLYVQVTNNGPRDARNVVVNARITPSVGTEYIYPADWTLVDNNHVSPKPISTTFATIPANSSRIAKFIISPDQVDALWGWTQNGLNWHPCLLASVTADNDYAFSNASLPNLIARRNNLAQRNLSVIDKSVLNGGPVNFPFLAGNQYNEESVMEIVVDRSQLPNEMKLFLSIDDEGKAFPCVDMAPSSCTPINQDEGSIIFLDRTRIKTNICGFNGILTLERGSQLNCLYTPKIKRVSVEGGEVILRNNKRFVEIKENFTFIQLEKQPNQLYPLSLQTTIPTNSEKGKQYTIKVSQRNQNKETVGGATVTYLIK
ncbi:S8 family serine peptidase [Priestia megaterium]|uniref:S8 family serine peptidase n=1 Tax=Priestia megaterium TaxID=1404 RepID=UPI002FFED6B1